LTLAVSEIQQITGLTSTAKIEQDIHHLADLGLILQIRHSPSLLPAQETAVTPSSLGLLLYARCHGHRGALASFYGVVEASGSRAAITAITEEPDWQSLIQSLNRGGPVE
jgi:hypothetical protein